MDIKLNSGIKKAFSLLNEAGFSAYLVGGAVRDNIIGLEPKDYDMTTDATIEDIQNVFKDYKLKLYARGDTILLRILGTSLEVTPFKGSTIIEDLSNRDYTINAIAYNESLGLVDPFNGVRDSLNRVLRTVKAPEDVFSYDPLRILRGIRLIASKGLSVDKSLAKAMNDYSYLLKGVKIERFRAELDEIMLYKKPSDLIITFKEVFFYLFPELKSCYGFDQHNKKWHHLDVFMHIMAVVDHTKNNLALRYAALFHDIMKPRVFVMDEFGIGHFPNHEVESMKYAYHTLRKYLYNDEFSRRVARLILYHDYEIAPTEKSELRFLYKFGTDDLDLLFGLKRADILAQNPSLIDRIYEIDTITEGLRGLLKDNKIVTYKNLKINGRVLLELGYEPRLIGRALEILLEMVQKRRIKNDRDKLYEYARRLKYELE